MDNNEIIDLYDLYNSEKWKEISALYCFDDDVCHELSKIEKPKSNVKPYIKFFDMNQNDPYAKKKPAVEIGIKVSF